MSPPTPLPPTSTSLQECDRALGQGVRRERLGEDEGARVRGGGEPRTFPEGVRGSKGKHDPRCRAVPRAPTVHHTPHAEHRLEDKVSTNLSAALTEREPQGGCPPERGPRAPAACPCGRPGSGLACQGRGALGRGQTRLAWRFFLVCHGVQGYGADPARLGTTSPTLAFAISVTRGLGTRTGQGGRLAGDSSISF